MEIDYLAQILMGMENTLSSVIGRRTVLKMPGFLLLAGCADSGLEHRIASPETAHQKIIVNEGYSEFPFRFYLDRKMVQSEPELDFARRMLPIYIQDMNYVLAKNTAVQLRFDPESDIILVDSKPQSDSSLDGLWNAGLMEHFQHYSQQD